MQKKKKLKKKKNENENEKNKINQNKEDEIKQIYEDIKSKTEGDNTSSFCLFNPKNLNIKDEKIEDNNLNKEELNKNIDISKSMLPIQAKAHSNLDKMDNNLNPPNNKNNKEFYSYECTNFNLAAYIYEGEDESQIDLSIKNNGTLDWPKDKAKLVFAKNSEVFGDNVILNAQKCGEEVKYKVKFNNLKDYKENEYKSYLRFEVNGEIIGEELALKNVIKAIILIIVIRYILLLFSKAYKYIGNKLKTYLNKLILASDTQ